MIYIALVWIFCIVIVYKSNVGAKAQSCGLPLMVLLATTFEYLGGFAYALPGYDHVRIDGSAYLQAYNFTAETVFRGMSVALLGIVAFTVGVTLSSRASHMSRTAPARTPFNGDSFALVFLIGLAGLALSQIELAIPMIGAFTQIGQLTMICAIAFGLFMSMKGIRGRASVWLALSAVLPVYYLLMLGFMSYGFQAFIIISVFYLAVIMKKPPSMVRFVPYFLIATYVLLTACAIWLSLRTELRAVLWSDAGIIERLEALFGMFSQMSILNPFDFESIDLLVTRINHGLWVGKVIEFHELHPEARLDGAGLFMSLFAWVPRFLWPGKPEAGGSIMLEANTGYEFASGVTFGAGQVVDFYVNFGVLGVIVGFFILGIIVSWVDRSAIRYLRSGNLILAAKYFVIGLCLTRSLSEVFFLVSTIVFTVLVFYSVQLLAPKLVAVKRQTRSDAIGRPFARND